MAAPRRCSGPRRCSLGARAALAAVLLCLLALARAAAAEGRCADAESESGCPEVGCRWRGGRCVAYAPRRAGAEGPAPSSVCDQLTGSAFFGGALGCAAPGGRRRALLRRAPASAPAPAV
ncbi:hypothetical protein Rsub_03896 [Raphidocelis subcapitata]|uniref:Uncharacterized protein n=1 Tax=Raphidocelis subcapitata TaxID=307507 RepID=A0A2V0NZM2_9CHLO|nr:hypothetical protein Rsub_03896 [Raphidocelis subcapitata]|eukprot:GBF91040.1 hypothetical protein Rsub_03896 [Raphidocelis subcapitata]